MSRVGGLEYVLDWLKTFLNATELSKNEMDSVFAFMLMWNAFEGKVFPEESSLTIESLHELGKSKGIVSTQVLNDVSKHFHNRYFVEEGGVRKFSNLKLKSEDKYRKRSLKDKSPKKYVEDALRDTTSNETEVLIALLLVAHRFRNNLFHGIKNIDALKTYSESFEKINQLLQEIVINYHI